MTGEKPFCICVGEKREGDRFCEVGEGRKEGRRRKKRTFDTNSGAKKGEEQEQQQRPAWVENQSWRGLRGGAGRGQDSVEKGRRGF